MRDEELKPTKGQIICRLLIYAMAVSILSLLFFSTAVLFWPA